VEAQNIVYILAKKNKKKNNQLKLQKILYWNNASMVVLKIIAIN
jgi:hypothetical protein